MNSQASGCTFIRMKWKSIFWILDFYNENEWNKESGEDAFTASISEAGSLAIGFSTLDTGL